MMMMAMMMMFMMMMMIMMKTMLMKTRLTMLTLWWWWRWWWWCQCWWLWWHYDDDYADQGVVDEAVLLLSLNKPIPLQVIVFRIMMIIMMIMTMMIMMMMAMMIILWYSRISNTRSSLPGWLSQVWGQWPGKLFATTPHTLPSSQRWKSPLTHFSYPSDQAALLAEGVPSGCLETLKSPAEQAAVCGWTMQLPSYHSPCPLVPLSPCPLVPLLFFGDSWRSQPDTFAPLVIPILLLWLLPRIVAPEILNKTSL